MKKFIFKFDHVLKFRKLKEDEALRDLAAQQKKYQSEVNKKENLISDLSRSLARKDAIGQGYIAISEYVSENNFISGTQHRIVQSDQHIYKAKKNVEKYLRSYLFFRRQTKIIESLYERSFLEFKKKMAVKESKDTDDLNIMRNRIREQEELL